MPASGDFLDAASIPSSLQRRAGLRRAFAANAPMPTQRFQFERHGYFVADRVDHTHAAPVFNRITGLKDSWAK